MVGPGIRRVRLQLGKKILYCTKKQIIAIAGYHVAGTTNIDHSRAGDALSEFRRYRFVHHIAVAAAYQ